MKCKGFIPRSEHPDPQWARKTFYNLNGEWDFEIDRSSSGYERGLADKASLSSKIIVPFCPESSLSGIGETDFLNTVWYKKTVNFDLSALIGKRVILHFGAAVYKTRVWINGKSAGDEHVGGFSPFEFDITDLLVNGDNIITVCCDDDPKDPSQPVGKQSEKSFSYGCHYTRVTGIWQTVWYEIVPLSYVKKMKLVTDPDASTVSLSLELCGYGSLLCEAFYEGKKVGEASRAYAEGVASIQLTLSEQHLWQVGKGGLYDLRITFGDDIVESYFGLRRVSLKDGRLLINGSPVFMRLVLDQGYYPKGLYTAQSESDLIGDIELAVSAGFNGARPHQKVFEPRYLYHADKLGFLLFGEYGSWGIDLSDPANVKSFLPDWLACVERDINHPSVIGWCPFNETSHTANPKGAEQDPDFIRLIYNETKRCDPTRPCIDASGWTHVKTDIYDVHDYTQSPEQMHERYDALFKEGKLYDRFSEVWQLYREWRGLEGPIQQWRGEPVFMSEYGGIGLHIVSDKDKVTAWSYGNAAKSLEEFYERYKGLTYALLDNPKMIGFCYTQLYDIEQEQNGLCTYDRKPKIDISVLKQINSRKAAIED